jgi:hypothetical protein
MANGIAASLQTTITIGGESLGGIQSFDEATGQITRLTGDSALAAGKSGTLSTRTDDDTGIVTLSAGHGMTSNMLVNVHGEDAVRYGMVATVDGNDVTVEGGAGDNLPDEDAEVVVSQQRVIPREIDASDIALIAVQMSEVGHVEFREPMGAAKAGTLTTRTDDDTGVAGLSGGHGIVTGNIVNVLWTAGARYGMVATVDVNDVTVDGGIGDALPDEDTAVTLHIRGATICGVECPENQPWQWNEQSGLTNPLEGKLIGEMRLGNGAASANEVRIGLLINDIQ